MSGCEGEPLEARPQVAIQQGAAPSGSAAPTVELLGMRFAAIGKRELVQRVSDSLAEGAGGWILTANVDYLQRYREDSQAASIYDRCSLIVADGVPLLWAARIQGTPLPERVAGSDLVWLLAEASAQRGHSIFLLGGAEGAAGKAAARFREQLPSLQIAGAASPMVSAEPTAEELQVLRRELAAAQPGIVYVAFGAPKEERVIAALREEFPATWFIGVGISLSFVAGGVRRAPRWIQRMGFEWLHRLFQEPQRLARRYLLRNLPFALSLLAEAVRTRLAPRRRAAGS